MTSCVASMVSRPTSTSPGSAEVCSRLAMFTTSPSAVTSPPARSAPTSTSPVFTPIRIRTFAPVSAACSGGCAASAARADGALRIVLVGDRRAEDGHDLVPDDLVDAASVRADVGRETVEAAVEEVLHVLGIAVLGQRCEADDVGEQDGDDAAFVGVADRGAPQDGQNRAPAGKTAPQEGHGASVTCQRYRSPGASELTP